MGLLVYMYIYIFILQSMILAYFFQVKLIAKTIMTRKCINHPNPFCYVRGSFITEAQRRTITPDLQKLYQLYFGCPLGDKEKFWVSHIICTSCSNEQRDWMTKGKRLAMPFAIPMI